MKIKPRNEILTDIIREGKKQPKGWNAAFGHDNQTFSHDCYIFHPNIGIFLLKEYHKNPYTIRGIGTKIARHIDDDISEQFHKKSGDFGIIQGDFQKILFNINKGIPPQKILESALNGPDLGLKIPVRGHASTSKETLDTLNDTFSIKQKKLAASFEKMITEVGVYTSYG